ncbi:MAG: hypothetical protein KDB61_12290, partial [Planctomycetes bacterium]|nr:hypothetical protein [Planctomycetota bacterium]
GRLICLVRDEAGYRNLCKLVSARQLGHDPGSPRDENEDGFDLVHAAVRWQEGLFFLADHPHLLLQLYGRVKAGQVFAALPPRNPDTPRGQGYTLPRPTGGSIKTPDPAPPFARTELIDAARTTGAALLAVPDMYYPTPRDRAQHRLQVAIKRGALLVDLPPSWMCAEPGHLLDGERMHTAYADVCDVPGEWPVEGEGPAPLLRTLAVAKACDYAPPLGGVLFPRVDLEDHETPYSKLCQMAFDGARKRYRPIPPEVMERLNYELSTLEKLGFAPYFLLVERIAAFAKKEGIPHVGRGSAADSLVAYCLELTDADPLRYKLPFERFLNPGRKDRPDVDLDFCWRRRDEVLQHVFELFDPSRTAMISTLNRFGARSAFREAALAHGIPPAEFQRWSHRIPMYGGIASGGGAVPFSGATEGVEDGEEGTSENLSQVTRNFESWERSTRPGLGGGGGGCNGPMSNGADAKT